MSAQIGYLDDNGHPRLTIRVTGSNPSACCDIDALLDTGFTGFLMLAVAQALPLGLTLVGTGDYQLADGTLVTNYLATGRVTIRPPTIMPPPVVPPLPPPPNPVPIMLPESVEGTIVLGGNGAILGMEFLRSLDKWLVVGRTVALLDNDSLPVYIPGTPAPGKASAATADDSIATPPPRAN
jgi:hypothetical protein